VEFRTALPKTLVGKVAFNVLEQEELTRLEAADGPSATGEGADRV
jgi:hypothetical protein